MRRASRFCQSLSVGSWTKICFTFSAVVAGAETVTVFGFLRKRSASLRISGGMVAEKNKSLTSGGQFAGDFLDIGNEAHIEHAVGFVDDENLDVVEHILPRS